MSTDPDENRPPPPGSALPAVGVSAPGPPPPVGAPVPGPPPLASAAQPQAFSPPPAGGQWLPPWPPPPGHQPPPPLWRSSNKGGRGKTTYMINAEAVVVDAMAWPIWAVSEVVLAKLDSNGIGTVDLRFDAPGMMPRLSMKDTPGAEQAFGLLASSVPAARRFIGLADPVLRSSPRAGLPSQGLPAPPPSGDPSPVSSVLPLAQEAPSPEGAPVPRPEVVQPERVAPESSSGPGLPPWPPLPGHEAPTPLWRGSNKGGRGKSTYMINSEAVVVDTMAWPIWGISEVVLQKVDSAGVGTLELRFDAPGMAPRISLKDTPGAAEAFELLASSVPEARQSVGVLARAVLRAPAPESSAHAPPPVPPAAPIPAPVAAAPVPVAPKDPNTLWEGQRRTVTAATTGMVRATYRITKEMIYFDAGVLSSKSEQIPLWAVRDVDLKQSVTQKARHVGDVIVRCQHSDYTGRARVALESIQDPKAVRDLLNSESQRARLEHQTRAQTVHYSGGLPGVAPQPSMAQPLTVATTPSVPTGPPVSIADELKKLAELRDIGVLTEDEFAAQKARLLNG